MRILLLSPANSIHTVRWANAMAERNFEVCVVSCKNHIEEVNKYDERVEVRYLKFNSGLGYYLNKRSLKKIIKEFNPDVINVHYASGYGTLARVAKIKKYLLNVWGSDIYEFPNESKFKKRIIKKNLKTATLLASTSNCMATETSKYTDRKLFITPFGVDTEKFKKRDVGTNEKFVFCTVKTLAPIYDIKGIVEAFALFIKKLAERDENLCQKVEYRIYGTGEQKEEIEHLISKLGLQYKVFLMGYINNNLVADAINASDVFLLKSEQESFGVAAIEAMACSKPVIASDVPGFAEVIENGKSGIIVEKNDTEKYADAMLDLYFNGERRRILGENARRRVEELYDWNKNVDTMIEIYKKLVNIG